jgi:protease I
MHKNNLKDHNVAVLATDGFEQSELAEPVEALKEAGATVHVIAPRSGRIKGWNHTQWGEEVAVDRVLDQVRADEYDALVLPGGVMNPDKLRIQPKAVEFVRAFFEQQKPVAAICHGPWLLVEADVVHGRRVTSYESIKTDLRNAGAEWVDEEVVVDNGLVTSRKPDDLPAFIDKMLEEIGEGIHAGQHA